MVPMRALYHAAMRFSVWATVMACGCAGARWDPAHPTPGGPPPPELGTPSPGETFETARPTFRWRLPRGVDEARLNIARGGLCDEAVETLTVRGEQTVPTRDLPSGAYRLCIRSVAGAHVGRHADAGFAVNLKV